MDEYVVLVGPIARQQAAGLPAAAGKAFYDRLAELRRDRRGLLPDGPDQRRAVALFGEGGAGMIFLTVVGEISIANYLVWTGSDE